MNERSFTITGMDLSGYMVKDAARAIAFYRRCGCRRQDTRYTGSHGAQNTRLLYGND